MSCWIFAQDLLYRRTKALIDYENSNKALDKARLKSKDVKLAEAHQQECCQKFEQLSESAKEGWSRVFLCAYVTSHTMLHKMEGSTSTFQINLDMGWLWDVSSHTRHFHF